MYNQQKEDRVFIFRKSRDFGELLSDTFKFFKFEFNPLIKVLLFYVGPFVLISSLIQGYYQMGEMENIDLSGRDVFGTYRRMLSLEYLLVILSIIASHSILMSALFSYMKLYVKNGKDGFTIDDVKRMMMSKFLPVFGAMTVIFILGFIGTILCVVPFFYVATIFSLVIPAIVFADKNLAEAIERSNTLVKEHFWFTLGIGVVAVIIAYVAIMIVSMPTVIVAFIYGFSSVTGDAPGETMEVAMIVLTVITGFLNIFIFAIPHTTMALHYFSQIEKRESPGLIDQINQINRNKDQDTGY